jgi:hypothetical protein
VSKGTNYGAIELGAMPVDTINRTLGTELEEGNVRVSRTAHKHIAEDHPADYELVMASLSLAIATPTYLGQAPHHGRNIELIRRVRVPDGTGYVLVAVGLEPDARGDYAVRSAYVVKAEQVEQRRQKGRLWPPK